MLKDFTKEKLINTIDKILNDEKKYKQLKEKKTRSAIEDGRGKIA